MNAIDGDAEKEETDADFEGGSGECVEDFAEEPVLDGECWLVSSLLSAVKTDRLTIRPICAVSSSRRYLFLPFP